MARAFAASLPPVQAVVASAPFEAPELSGKQNSTNGRRFSFRQYCLIFAPLQGGCELCVSALPKSEPRSHGLSGRVHGHRPAPRTCGFPPCRCLGRRRGRAGRIARQWDGGRDPRPRSRPDPWIVGGSWLRVDRRKADLLHRDVDAVAQVIAACRAGCVTIDCQPRHPHGFCSAISMGEVAPCRPLHDPRGTLAGLKATTSPRPRRSGRRTFNSSCWRFCSASRMAKSPSRGATRRILPDAPTARRPASPRRCSPSTNAVSSTRRALRTRPQGFQARFPTCRIVRSRMDRLRAPGAQQGFIPEALRHG